MMEKNEHGRAFDPATDYRATMDRLLMLTALLKEEPIGEMLDHVERTDVLGPILCPREYHLGRANLDDQREILQALLQVQNTVHRILARSET